MRFPWLLLAPSILMSCAGDRPSSPTESKPAPVLTPPPAAPRANVRETLHGVDVPDPFRPLEDIDAPAVRTWVLAQEQRTRAFLDAIPERAAIKDRLTRLWNFERFGLPEREGGRQFYTRNSGLQNQPVLFVVAAPGAEPRVLLDPNTLSSDGTMSLGPWSVSHDGKHLAYGISDGGSDWTTWRIRSVDSGQDLPDVIRWSKFSGAAWHTDHSGFWYSRYDAPRQGAELQSANYCMKLCFHKLGTSQEQDQLVYERPDQKEWGFQALPTEDGRYLVLHVWQGTDPRNRVFYQDLAEDHPTTRELLSDFDAKYQFVGNDGPVFYFLTDLAAPRGRLLAIDVRQPDRARWRELLAQGKDTIQNVSLVGDAFVVDCLADARSLVRVYDRDGKLLREVDLPGIGTATGFAGKRNSSTTSYAFTSFTAPTTIWDYDVVSGKSTLLRSAKVDFQPADYVTEQVFVTSKDGTRVPMFLSHKRGLPKDGRQRVLLYGYGGFNIALTPSFSVANLVWMEMGGVLAVANLRGGSEYGEEWHLAGTKARKQNVFDDFIAAAEWLIRERWTTTSRLAIQGGSNGGLLVGACLTQRPDLFGACLPAVGVLDMLRFHKFTIGWAWTSDYGCADQAEEFKALHAYSPLHNVRPGVRYPPTLILTADHDDRVYPAHSFKFAAALQEAQGGSAPILLRVETRAGHGAGTPTGKKIEEVADQWAFLGRVLD